MKPVVLTLILAAAAAAQESASEWGRVRAYFSGGVMFSRDDAAFSKQTPYVAFDLDKNWFSGGKLLVNTFFDTRLTSIPVAGDNSSFAKSEKAAQAGGGVYLPYLTTQWTYGGQKHALFVAPLAEAGFQTPTASRVDHFYTASGFGVRLGHFRMPSDEGAAPELVSWLDVVYGKFTSFADSQRRLSVEGTLRAPGTPIVVGFSANIGRNGSVRDDLRLFIGTRFDLGALVAKLKN